MIASAFAWSNGAMVPFAEATVHASAFALHYGMAVFEGVRCYRRADGRSAVFRLHDHIVRLFDSAKICGFEIPFAPAAIEDACRQVMKDNGLAEGYIRPLALRGAGSLGLGARDNPIDVVVICWPWPAALGASDAGIRTQTSSFVRGHTNNVMSKAKVTGQYVISVLAKQEAARLGFDDALMLDAEGRVVEASAQNVFMVKGERVFTPPLELSILAGITRDTVLTLAREAAIDVVERAFTRDALYAADEVFLTGTAAEVAPVREVDGRTIGDGAAGPITRKLRAMFFDAVRGSDETHPGWLQHV